jgi:hypothetical protein
MPPHEFRDRASLAPRRGVQHVDLPRFRPALKCLAGGFKAASATARELGTDPVLPTSICSTTRRFNGSTSASLERRQRDLLAVSPHTWAPPSHLPAVQHDLAAHRARARGAPFGNVAYRGPQSAVRSSSGIVSKTFKPGRTASSNSSLRASMITSTSRRWREDQLSGHPGKRALCLAPDDVRDVWFPSHGGGFRCVRLLLARDLAR